MMKPYRPIAALAFALAALPPSVLASTPVEIRSGDVELVVRDDGVGADATGGPWREWLTTSLEAARTVTGRFPRERVIVDLRPATDATDAIAFGQIRRSDPPRIRFWVDPDADAAALAGDWRAYHEFVHLLIPFPGNRDIWFTEGFASYYQYLVQSRAGLISEREAWSKLLAGFERGERDPAGRGRSLRQLSPEMWRERAFRRVYWTGAAFFLRVDTRLRTISGGEMSLDAALRRFHRCCLDTPRRWDAQALIARLGELSIPGVWEREYRRTIDAPARPEYRDALDLLGIDAYRGGLRLSDDPAARALRDAIAGPRGRAAQSDGSIAP